MIYDAIHTALIAHGDQKRKLDNDQYIAHPIEVGILLAKNQMSNDVICAGILHDTLEDTHLTYDNLCEKFGLNVANLVNAVTEQDTALPWQTRKENYLTHLQSASKEVFMIVCADKLSNLQSIARYMEAPGADIWSKFNAGYESQRWYYDNILEILSPIDPEPLYVNLKKLIQEVFY